LTIALAAVAIAVAPRYPASAQETRCSALFPDVAWTTQQVDGPTSLETAGFNTATAERFGEVVGRLGNLIDSEIGGLDGSAVCLASPDLADAFSEYVARGQRLHAGVFAEEGVLVLSAVEVRMIDDAIAFGLPQLALRRLGEDLGSEQGYPDPLGTTIAHWYSARETGRLDVYRSQLVITLFLDDPNPQDRTAADANQWVGESKPDPSFFDPQFLGSQMGVFIDFAVSEEGLSVFRKTDQATWADLENRWRIWIRDQYPQGSFGVWWGVAFVIFFIALAIALAWLTHRQKQRASMKRPTPPPDEHLFGPTAAKD